jgi:S-formylglutathione hydrolase
MQNDVQLRQEHFCFGGKLGFYRHPSQMCNSEMRFAVYQPPQAQTQAVPVLYFLSGLTCTEENFMVKAGAQQFAAHYGLMLVAPDTSPRHTGIPGEDDAWDLGTGAGFYVDATVAPWRDHYRMYSYVVDELPALIATTFPVRRDRQGIFGHSMGGHGALVCGLRNCDRYQSISAFAPIAAPSRVPWGQNAFTHYLGDEPNAWRDYDATELVNRYQHPNPILVDQGMADGYLDQLMPDAFEKACTASGQSLYLRRHAHYDHGYYFIATFIGDHIRHHADILKQGL